MTRRRAGLWLIGMLVSSGARHSPAAARTSPKVRRARGKALLQAVQRGDVTAAIHLLQVSADVNYQDAAGQPTPLLASVAAFAEYRGSIDLVRWLLEGGAKPNLRGKDGWTALTLASHLDVEAAIAPLLKARADPNLPTGTGVSALTLAAAAGSTRSVRLLLRAGARPDVVEATYGTPLIQAALAGRMDVIDALLEGGASPNLANREGVTPLMAAAGCQLADREESRVNYGSSVLMLLRRGADRNTTDRQGRTAMDHAAAKPPGGRLTPAIEDERHAVLQLLRSQVLR